MNLPTMNEIEIHDYAVQVLVEAFKEHFVGERPCFIEVELKQRKLLEPALDNIMAALEIIGVDPRFPYPLYLVTPYVKKFLDLPIVPDRKSLPKHFFSRSARLNSKEQALLKKTKLLTSKIKNNHISDIALHIQSESSTRKMLIKTCQEVEFLENIFDGLQDTTARLKEKEV